jgi:hypothetical protein
MSVTGEYITAGEAVALAEAAHTRESEEFEPCKLWAFMRRWSAAVEHVASFGVHRYEVETPWAANDVLATTAIQEAFAELGAADASYEVDFGTFHRGQLMDPLRDINGLKIGIRWKRLK